MQEQETGTVKWFNDQKGFGFITPDSGRGDVFVHANAVAASGINNLREGQKISYDLQHDSRKGKDSAANLMVAA